MQSDTETDKQKLNKCSCAEPLKLFIVSASDAN